MPFRLNISDKGKAWRIETDAPGLLGKSVGDTISGSDISSDFAGYELEITGGSDFAGFPLSKNVEGINLKKVLLKKGWGMWSKGNGLRMRKTVRGKTITDKTLQINIKVLKHGSKKLTELFPDQNQPKEKAVKVKAEAVAPVTQ